MSNIVSELLALLTSATDAIQKASADIEEIKKRLVDNPMVDSSASAEVVAKYGGIEDAVKGASPK